MAKKTVPSHVKQRNPKNKRNKTTLVFDEKARQEFLTGFQKRKAERRKVAQQKIIADLKDEKKKLKLKKREELDAKWRELNTHCSMDRLSEPVTYDLSAHVVTVTDISQVDFAGTSGFHLGTNQGEEPDLNDVNTKERLQPSAEADETKDTEDNESKVTGSRKKKRSLYQHQSNKHKNLTHLMSKRNMAKKKQLQKRENSGPQRIRMKKKQKRRN